MYRVFSVTVVVRVLLRLIVDFGVGKYLRNSCHLAAESGTRFSLPVYMSSLLGVFNSYFGGCFSWEFLIVLFSSYVDDIAFIKI